ncbi:stage V sporulation protein AA, partial [Shouchella clausii]
MQIRPNQRILLKDIAQVIADEDIYEKLCALPLYQVSEQDRNIVVIDVMKVIRTITQLFSKIEVQSIGPAQAIVEVVTKKRKVS